MRSNQKSWLSSRRVRRFREARGCGGCWSSSSPLETTWTEARGETPWASSWRVSPGSLTQSPAATRAWPSSTSWPAPARRRWAWALSDRSLVMADGGSNCPLITEKNTLKYLISVPRMSFPWSRSPTHQGRCQSQVCWKRIHFSQSVESQRRERKTPDYVSYVWLTAGLFDTNLSLICIVRIHLLQFVTKPRM